MNKNSMLRNKPIPHWWYELWPVVLGVLVLYIPTYYGLLNGIWSGEDNRHGPIVLLVTLYLIWKNLDGLSLNPTNLTWTVVVGGGILILGLFLYIIGHSQEIVIFEVGSQVFVFAGILLCMSGWKALQAMWFPLFFILFMLPLPGAFLDAVTMPMKMAVSFVVEHILFWLGYPIARTGVILQIGQYQLLVADACAGMHTLISLEALGLLYLNLVKHDSIFRNITLAILIIPISFTANVIRVLILVLITYYFGDAAGQGFIHGFAGLVLFVVALTFIMSVDTLLQYIAKHWSFNKPMKTKITVGNLAK